MSDLLKAITGIVGKPTTFSNVRTCSYQSRWRAFHL